MAHPTDAWVAQQLREATPFGQTAKHLICEDDPKFGPAFDAAAETCGLEVIHTPYEAQARTRSAGGLWGSVRHECLDHLLVLGNRHLVHTLVEYAGYFNPSRPHQVSRSKRLTRASRAKRSWSRAKGSRAQPRPLHRSNSQAASSWLCRC